MHPAYVHNGFLILALICFLIDGFKFEFPKIRWNFTVLGYACVVGAFLFPFFI